MSRWRSTFASMGKLLSSVAGAVAVCAGCNGTPITVAPGDAAPESVASDAGTPNPAPGSAEPGSDAKETGSPEAPGAIPLCIPGQTISCACVGAASGAQTCMRDGTFGVCQCPSPTAVSPAPDATSPGDPTDG